MQVGVGGAAAQPVALGELEAPNAFLPCAVEVGIVLVSRLAGGLEHRVDERVHRAAVGHPGRPARSVVRVLAALVVLAALEVRQDIVVAPARTAGVGPAVVIGTVAADVDHRVDRTTAAEHAPAWQVEAPVVQPRLRLAFEVPVEARLKERGKCGRMWISGWESGPPASSSATLTAGSSLSRAASTQPADPAPTIT